MTSAEWKELKDLAYAMFETAIECCEFKHQVDEVTVKYQELRAKIDELESKETKQ